jgi:hypothetical protein
VALWIDDREFYRKGDRVAVAFRSDTDGYVTVLRLDTDGRLEILFPREPGQSNYVRGGRLLALDELRGRTGLGAFVVDDYPGVGYLFAVVSLDRIDYGAWAHHGRWDVSTVGRRGRVRGDPYVILSDLIERLLPPGYSTYAYDVVPYLVAHRPPVYSAYRDWCATFRQGGYDFGALPGGYYVPIASYQLVYPAPINLTARTGQWRGQPRRTGHPRPRRPAATAIGRRPAPTIAARDPQAVRRPAPTRSGTAGDLRRPSERRGAARPASRPAQVAGSHPAASGRRTPSQPSSSRRFTVVRGYR